MSGVGKVTRSEHERSNGQEVKGTLLFLRVQSSREKDGEVEIIKDSTFGRCHHSRVRVLLYADKDVDVH